MVMKECLDLTANEPPDPSGVLSLTAEAYSAGHAPLAYAPTLRPTQRARTIHLPDVHINARTRDFHQRFFPQASLKDWNDWRWQLKNRFATLPDIARVLDLSDDERRAMMLPAHARLSFAVTPYYASLLDPGNPAQPVRRCVIPSMAETLPAPGEADDPLGEDAHMPVPGLVHRYPDRVLFLVTDFCSTYCRYCTRSRAVGGHKAAHVFKKRWEKALAYIAATPQVRDVLLSGGDALTLSDEAIDWLLGQLRSIPHVEFVRMGSKVPAVLPQRVTKSLTRVLKRHHPLWVSLHFAHPDELTPETVRACEMLADAGVPLGSQTVLLKGVNDDPATMTALFHGLLKARVRPYYLYQCDPISGSGHFRTPVKAGIDIIRALRGHTTGYAVPHYVIDAPGGGGKIPICPEYVQGHDGTDLVLTNYEGKTFRYPDTAGCETAE
jgi:lysine 2,3-aminomutase